MTLSRSHYISTLIYTYLYTYTFSLIIYLHFQFIVETSLSKTRLTKIITIFPMFVMVNKLSYLVRFQEFIDSDKLIYKKSQRGQRSIKLKVPRSGEQEEVDSERTHLIGVKPDIWIDLAPGEVVTHCGLPVSLNYCTSFLIIHWANPCTVTLNHLQVKKVVPTVRLGPLSVAGLCPIYDNAYWCAYLPFTRSENMSIELIESDGILIME